ncbi:translation initiation factor-like protein eif-2b subunit alpha [Xylariaceae sp. FL0804]|nr:translation initiation factor-like protein eif-2b subunit alpha [Xylariaceae sp. FL0804]
MATGDDSGHKAPSHQQLPVRSNPEMGEFDIVKTYYRLLADDPDLTMPVAAIEALIEALGASSATTVFETMELVKTQSEALRAAVPNPVPLSHGTELFKQYLVRTLNQQASAAGSGNNNNNNNTGGGSGGGGGGGSSSHENFEVVRQHLMRNGRLFAARAKEDRERIAVRGRRFVFDGATVLTYGGSRAVGTLLGRAAEAVPGDAARRFRVFCVESPSSACSSSSTTSGGGAGGGGANRVAAALRARGVPVAVVGLDVVASVMAEVDFVLVGAQAVYGNGGVLARMGTYGIACHARAHGKDVYVAAEQHKFGTTLATTQARLGFAQDRFDFHASKRQEPAGSAARDARLQQKQHQHQLQLQQPAADLVDYTPPTLIEDFICNHGVRTPVAVAGEIIMDFF